MPGGKDFPQQALGPLEVGLKPLRLVTGGLDSMPERWEGGLEEGAGVHLLNLGMQQLCLLLASRRNSSHTHAPASETQHVLSGAEENTTKV